MPQDLVVGFDLSVKINNFKHTRLQIFESKCIYLSNSARAKSPPNAPHEQCAVRVRAPEVQPEQCERPLVGELYIGRTVFLHNIAIGTTQIKAFGNRYELSGTRSSRRYGWWHNGGWTDGHIRWQRVKVYAGRDRR